MPSNPQADAALVARLLAGAELIDPLIQPATWRLLKEAAAALAAAPAQGTGEPQKKWPPAYDHAPVCKGRDTRDENNCDCGCMPIAFYEGRLPGYRSPVPSIAGPVIARHYGRPAPAPEGEPLCGHGRRLGQCDWCEKLKERS